ncbi:MAG: RNA polymerase sigma factor [Colwellia sp.]
MKRELSEARKKYSNSTLSRLTESFITHNVFLRKYLTRYVKEHRDIEDILQDVYINAYKAEQSKEIENPKAFLFRVAKNIALNQLKKKSTTMTRYIEESQTEIVMEKTDDLELEISAEQSLEIYCQAVESLPNKCKRVYILRKVQGLTHKEISEKLDITVSCVEKHLHTGLLRCRRYIRERNEQDNTDNSVHIQNRKGA